ncbi:hypothetical protein AB0L06_27390 [Spirillospora sp. NPDC052269]
MTGQARAETAIAGSGHPHRSGHRPAGSANYEPDLSLREAATPMAFSGPGQPIRFTYHVTNIGDVPLVDVGIIDHLPGLSHATCRTRALDVDESTNCTAWYHTTPRDVAAGWIHNVATARGVTPEDHSPAFSEPCEVNIHGIPHIAHIVPHIVPVLPHIAHAVRHVEHPAIGLRKRVRPKTYSRVGQVLQYSYRVTNTGTVTLHRVHIHDGLRGLSAISCPKRTLRRGESMTCTATYRVTRHDLMTKVVRNRAFSKGTPAGSRVPVCSRLVSATAYAHIPVTG